MVDGPLFSFLISCFLIAFSLLTLGRYASQTWNIVWNRERGELGGYLAIFGVFLLSVGSLYTGIWNIAWLSYGQPMDWTATFHSAFGRFSMGCGFTLMFVSPVVTRERLRLIPSVWTAAAMAGVALLMFYLGTKYGTVADITSHIVACPSQTPVKGSATGIYHVPGGRSYARTTPNACFATADEAVVAGYRAAR